MVMAPTPLSIDESALATLCHSYGVARLFAFGSVLRGDFDPSHSDVDILVEFKPDTHKGLFKFLRLQNELTALCGRTVDLTTPASLSKYFRDDVMATAQVLYDAA